MKITSKPVSQGVGLSWGDGIFYLPEVSGFEGMEAFRVRQILRHMLAG